MDRRIRTGLVLGALLVVALVPIAGAQTPEAQPSGMADVPTECFVEPVSVLALLALLNDVESEGSFLPDLASVPLDSLQPGEPVSAQDMEGITFTTRMLVGCANSLQVMSVLALLTEDFQTRLAFEVLEGEDMDAVAEALPVLATDTAETAGIQAIPIRSAWYAEGNNRMIMAILEPEVSDPEAKRSFLVTYAFSVDHWLIHDIQVITGSGLD